MPEPIEFDAEGRIVLKLNWRRALQVLVILALAVGGYFAPIEALTPASRISLMIFIGAAGLWVTEAIPPFATAIMVIVLNIYLLGKPGGPLDFEATGYQVFLNPVASPILVLFFGGFILSIGATKHGFDVRLAKAFIKPFGTKPNMVLLGIILTTALFSMFMSNTATTAMMIAILGPLLGQFDGRTPFKRAMVLSVPFAANVGGIGTIIGTPPNAVAASVLGGLDNPISFLEWMLFGVPIALVLLFGLWAMLVVVFKPSRERFELLFPETLDVTWDLVIVLVTFTVTVVLWLTEPFHGIPAGVVALLPVMVFTMFQIIDRQDLKNLDWDVLILVAGGMALGVSMTRTGLSDILVNQISGLGLGAGVLLVAIALVSLLLSNFMSNTSAANLMIPIVTSFAVLSPRFGAVMVAFACSLAMSLPISTPPNAIAFATREITTQELARYGTFVSMVGFVVVVLLLWVAHGVFGFP
jgi:sodium-dependent dicarboxylate transporter 2/3/5